MRRPLRLIIAAFLVVGCASCVPGRKLYNLEITRNRVVHYQGYYATADTFPTERLWERIPDMYFYASDDPKAIQPQVGTEEVTLRATEINARHGDAIARNSTFESIRLRKDQTTGLWRISNRPREMTEN